MDEEVWTVRDVDIFRTFVTTHSRKGVWGMDLTPDSATDLVRHTLILAMMIAAPMLLVGLVVGLIISLLQAVTQIQEQSLSFIPKTAAMIVSAIVLMPWISHRLLEYTTAMLGGGSVP
jgi:flagellar biosynthetic protein FliQ